jgi:hypothetical protein
VPGGLACVENNAYDLDSAHTDKYLKVLLAIFYAYSINFQRILYFHPKVHATAFTDTDLAIFI